MHKGTVSRDFNQPNLVSNERSWEVITAMKALKLSRFVCAKKRAKIAHRRLSQSEPFAQWSRSRREGEAGRAALAARSSQWETNIGSELLSDCGARSQSMLLPTTLVQEIALTAHPSWWENALDACPSMQEQAFYNINYWPSYCQQGRAARAFSLRLRGEGRVFSHR